MLANEGDEGLSGTRKAAVAAVDEAQFAPNVHSFDGEELHFTGLDVILGEAFADEGDAGIGGHEALDHADAGQFHGDLNARTIGSEELVQHLTGVTRPGKNERLPG